MEKITIVGAGRVGESTAQLLARAQLCREVMLIDVRKGVAEGTALDIQECAPLFAFDTKVRGATDPGAVAGSDLVIVTAGLPRKPGMSRSDVLDVNLSIINSVVDSVLENAAEAMLLLVTNPVDILTYQAWKRTGWSKNRVFGQAGVLDAARMASFIAMETGFSVSDINTMVLGGHGDAMVPMPRYTCINGIPIDRFLDKAKIDGIIERTRQGGAEILGLKQNSSAYDAPAAAIGAMVDAIVRNRKRVLPCVSLLEGEYGQTNIAMGVPAVLGDDGLEKVIELELTAEEQRLFDKSAEQLRVDMAKLT